MKKISWGRRRAVGGRGQIYIFFHGRGSVFSQWTRLSFRVGVNYFSSAEKLFMHEKALFAIVIC